MSKCDQCNKYKEVIRRLTIEKEQLKNQLRSVDVKGWKGKDSIRIEHLGQEWRIVEHRKDKATGIVGDIIKYIPEQNVIDLWEIIKEKTKDAKKTKYREIVPSIIMNNNLGLEVEEFNGGKRSGVSFFLKLRRWPRSPKMDLIRQI